MKTVKLIICLITVLLSCNVLTAFAGENKDNAQQNDAVSEKESVEDSGTSPLVVLTCPEDSDWELLYYSDFRNPEDPVVVTTYDSSRFSGYFNSEEDGVFFSDDGKYLYYFDPNSDTADDGGCALYRVLTEELKEDMFFPEFIDDYAIMNRAETSYVMETLDNDRLLYMGWEQTDEGGCYKLSMYEGGTSSTLLTGQEIFVSVSRDKTFANIAVMSGNDENINDWTWYRMDLGENSAPQFVCEGTLYPEDTVMQSYDYQVLTDHDMIINIMDRGEENGYYTVDLYEHGGYSKKLLEYYPWFSVGPFGITVKNNQDISFFTISTADGNAPVGATHQGDSQSWAFFQYKDEAYKEVQGISRFRINLPDNEVNFFSVRSVGDRVLYAKKDTPGSYWHYKVFDSEGKEILLETLRLESGENNDFSSALYAETSDKKKQFIEGDTLEDIVYVLDGKEYLVAYEYYKFFCMCLDDLTEDSIDSVGVTVDTDGYIEQILPCDANTILVLTQDGMYEWNGQELKESEVGSALGDTWIYSAWSRGRRIGNNIPRIY